MKAVQFAQYGDPQVLQIVEIDEPHAGPGQVRITARAAGVNGIDWKIRSGAMKDMMALDLPAGIGRDAAGIVDEVGPDVENVSVGDRVFGSGDNAYSEFVVLSAWAGMPDALSFDEAAGFPISVETAIRILDQVGVQSGETLVVSGASGGVGSAVVQIAHDRGVQVIGTAGRDNQDYLRSLGATATTYGDGLVERIRDLAPTGVDAALDISGSGVIPELIELTGDPQKVLTIADFGAGEYGAQISTEPADPAAAFAEAARLSAAGKLRLEVERRYPLAQAAEAHAQSAQGHARGRTVLTLS